MKNLQPHGSPSINQVFDVKRLISKFMMFLHVLYNVLNMHLCQSMKTEILFANSTTLLFTKLGILFTNSSPLI